MVIGVTVAEYVQQRRLILSVHIGEKEGGIHLNDEKTTDKLIKSRLDKVESWDLSAHLCKELKKEIHTSPNM